MRAFHAAAVIMILSAGYLRGAFLSEVEFIGFSPDGSHAALGQHWIQDGSGIPEAEILVYSVRNNMVIREFSASWTEEMLYGDGSGSADGTPWESVQEEAAPFLDSLGIMVENTGTHCLCHLPTDTGADPWHASFVTWMWSPGYTGPEYYLSLLLHPYTSEDQPEWLSMFDQPVALELFIEDSDGYRVMHMAEGEPEARYEYVSDYRIRDVYVCCDTMVAIVLNTTEPGFEGPDGMHRLVTGVIRD